MPEVYNITDVRTALRDKTTSEPKPVMVLGVSIPPGKSATFDASDLFDRAGLRRHVQSLVSAGLISVGDRPGGKTQSFKSQIGKRTNLFLPRPAQKTLATVGKMRKGPRSSVKARAATIAEVLDKESTNDLRAACSFLGIEAVKGRTNLIGAVSASVASGAISEAQLSEAIAKAKGKPAAEGQDAGSDSGA